MSILQVPVLSQQIAVIRSRILAGNKKISTVPGSVAGDLLVTPQAESDIQQFALTYYINAAKAVSDLLALKTNQTNMALVAAALGITTDDLLTEISGSLDDLGKNYNVSRSAATTARGSATLMRTDPPSSDITIPAGKIINGSNGKQYTTTQDVTFYAASSAGYYKSFLSRYTIEVPVTCTESGAAGNAPAYSLVKAATPVNGFPEVTNINAITGGSDLESDESFGASILLAWQAVGRTTKAGITKSITETIPGTSVFVATPGTTYSPRGKVDVWVKGMTTELVTETFNAFNHPTVSAAIVPTQHPVIEVNSIDSGTAYLQQDLDSAVAGSVCSKDVIRFTVAPTFPVTIQYTVDTTVANAQAVFNDDAKAPATQRYPTDVAIAVQTPILVKRAQPLPIDYIAKITVLPGYSKSTVISSVVSNILSFGESLLMGQIVYKTDINDIVEKTEGVLRLNGDPTKFSPATSSGVLNSITPAENQYAVFNSVVVS